MFLDSAPVYVLCVPLVLALAGSEDHQRWHSSIAQSSDFVTVQPHANPTNRLSATQHKGFYNSTSRPYTAQQALTDFASFFSFQLPKDGCSTHHNVSEASAQFGCDYATNAGFFAFTPPACEGNVVANTTVIQLPAPDDTNFGVTQNGTVVAGYLTAADIGALDFVNLVSGRGWLVRNGASYVNKTREFPPTDGFVTEKAPRSAVAVTSDGTIMLVTVDGVESTKEGPDLFELTELLLSLGAFHAVNMDGGGSTTAVYHQKIFNTPTCVDTPTPICERAVTTIACIKVEQR